MLEKEAEGKLKQPIPTRKSDTDAVVDENTKMLYEMSTKDIKEAMGILKEKARAIMKDAEGYNLYLASNPQNKYLKDFQLIQAARARKQREANILLRHVNNAASSGVLNPSYAIDVIIYIFFTTQILK